jgi:hypothetical protein
MRLHEAEVHIVLVRVLGDLELLEGIGVCCV